MISDVACDPELPPELMTSGMNMRQHDRASRSRASKCCIAVAVSISERNSAQSQPRALPDHVAEADFHVWRVERLHTAELLHVLVCSRTTRR